jgi:magnesium-transporting ATPase (P-type)
VWMLTGDKGETARMIGITCGLLKEGEKLIRIDDDLESVQPIIAMANESKNFEIMISGRSLS